MEKFHQPRTLPTDKATALTTGSATDSPSDHPKTSGDYNPRDQKVVVTIQGLIFVSVVSPRDNGSHYMRTLHRRISNEIRVPLDHRNLIA